MQPCALCGSRFVKHDGRMVILKRGETGQQAVEHTWRYWLCQRCFESSGRSSRVKAALIKRDKARTN